MQFLCILTLIFSPLVAGVLLYTSPFKNNEVKIRRFAKGFASLHLLYALLFLTFFNPLNTDMSFYKEIKFFNTSWIEPMGLKMAFGLDGIALLMVILTSFIFLIALIASKSNIRSINSIIH